MSQKIMVGGMYKEDAANNGIKINIASAKEKIFNEIRGSVEYK